MSDHAIRRPCQREHRTKAIRSTCGIEGCQRARHARGLCNAHYERHRRNGTFDIALADDLDPTPAEQVEIEQAKLAAHDQHQRWLIRQNELAMVSSQRYRQSERPNSLRVYRISKGELP